MYFLPETRPGAYPKLARARRGRELGSSLEQPELLFLTGNP